MSAEALGWVRCPNGHLGRADADQLNGDVSIDCPTCEFHGYVGDDGVVVEEDHRE